MSKLEYLLTLLVFLLCEQTYAQQQQQQQQAPVAPNIAPDVKNKILIPNLHPSHYQFWLKNHPRAFKEFQQICTQAPHPSGLKKLQYFQSLHANLSFEDPRYLTELNYGKNLLNEICSKIDFVSKSCWGYENNCSIIHLMPECYGSKLGQAKDEQEQKIKWFSQADFGYILDRRREMSRYCSPDKFSNDSIKSIFECTKFFRTCRGENLIMRFQNIPKGGSLIKNPPPEIIRAGDVGGWNCDLQLKRIAEEAGHNENLQSWFNELKHYNHFQGPQTLKESCDIIIEKQAFVLKLESPLNMYHYFSNFINLYATIHLNNKFSEDNQIIIWDNHVPDSNYEKMWPAFSKNRLMSIGEFEGKRVCFKKVIFTLLPRMIGGLYQNTPLISGCSKTGLFDAFNKHVLHRLKVVQKYDVTLHKKTENKMIRIVLVSRSTLYRKIKNEKNLLNAVRDKRKEYDINIVNFESLDFQKQLDLVHNTDILVGIHGSGLTNLLFLPDWAVLVELHDCGDKAYHDLSRLRGVNYFTLSNKETSMKKLSIKNKEELKHQNQSHLIDNDKFSDYEIDQKEFMKLLDKVAEKVKKNRAKYFETTEKEKVVPATPTSEDIETVDTAKPQTKPLTETREEL